MKKDTILYIIIAVLFILLLLTYDNLRQLQNENNQTVTHNQGFPTELTVNKVQISSSTDVTLECKSNPQGDVDYIVYVTEDTVHSFDMSILRKGTEIIVYADAVMESYPMQMYANAIKLMD